MRQIRPLRDSFSTRFALKYEQPVKIWNINDSVYKKCASKGASKRTRIKGHLYAKKSKIHKRSRKNKFSRSVAHCLRKDRIKPTLFSFNGHHKTATRVPETNTPSIFRTIYLVEKSPCEIFRSKVFRVYIIFILIRFLFAWRAKKDVEKIRYCVTYVCVN